MASTFFLICTRSLTWSLGGFSFRMVSIQFSISKCMFLFVFYASCFFFLCAATIFLLFRCFFFSFCRYSFKIYGIFVLCSSIFQVSKFSALFFSAFLFGTCLIFFSVTSFFFGFGDISICTFLLAVQSLMYVHVCVFGYYSHA